MERHGKRAFCCGAGGSRMWMEERIGKRVNVERTDEALGTGAEIIATSCPYCLIMLDDAVSAKKSEGGAQGVRVIDIAQVLADSIGLRKIPAMAGAPSEAADADTASSEAASPAATDSVDVHQPDASTPAVDAPEDAATPDAES
jgi:hypothetical protein